MKKLLLIFMAIICLAGCTIDISNKKSSSSLDEDIKDDESTEIVSRGISSSTSNPLEVGKYGIASKYNVLLDEYVDVDVTITNVYDNPDELIAKYNLENSDNLIEKEDGYKFVVLDYEVVFFDFETESFGTDVVLDCEVATINDDSFIVDEIKQVIGVTILSKDVGIVNGSSGSVRIAFAIPENIDNYLVKLGTHEHTIAYYKI